METSGGNSDPYRSSSIGGGSRSHALQFSSNFFRSPLSAILEYSGILRARPSHQENEGLIDERIGGVAHEHALSRGENSSVSSSGGGEVSIRIIGDAEQEHLWSGLAMGQVREVDFGESGVSESQIGGPVGHSSDRYAVGGSNGAIGEGAASSSSPSLASEKNSPSGNSDGEAGNGGGNNRDTWHCGRTRSVIRSTIGSHQTGFSPLTHAFSDQVLDGGPTRAHLAWVHHLLGRPWVLIRSTGQIGHWVAHLGSGIDASKQPSHSFASGNLLQVTPFNLF